MQPSPGDSPPAARAVVQRAQVRGDDGGSSRERGVCRRGVLQHAMFASDQPAALGPAHPLKELWILGRTPRHRLGDAGCFTNEGARKGLGLRRWNRPTNGPARSGRPSAGPIRPCPCHALPQLSCVVANPSLLPLASGSPIAPLVPLPSSPHPHPSLLPLAIRSPIPPLPLSHQPPTTPAFYRLADRCGNPWYGMSARRDAVSQFNMG